MSEEDNRINILEIDDNSSIFSESEEIKFTNVTSIEEMEEFLFNIAFTDGLNDIWISANESVMVRINGEIKRFYQVEPISEEVVNGWIKKVCGDSWKLNVDASYQVVSKDKKTIVRYRVNVYTQRGAYRICMRLINNSIPDAQKLGLPKRVIQVATTVKDGLIFFTGVTGSGKSTSISSLLDLRGKLRREHILTLEDPIETEFSDSTSFYSQREKGRDFTDFPTALTHALREAPNTILIGEIRDAETAEIALHAAETGHLVLATLHTRRAAQAVSRFGLMFSEERQAEIYKMLSDLLRVVVCQRLIPASGGGRVALLEVMDNQEGSSIRSLLSQGKIMAVTNSIRTGGDTESFSFERHLEALYKQQKITLSIYNEQKELLAVKS